MAELVKCNKCNDTGDYILEVSTDNSNETVTIYCDCEAGDYQMAWDEVELEEELELLLNQIYDGSITNEVESNVRTSTPVAIENKV